ncbi:MAG: trigger factor [Clostridiales bacterium]|nr:trigger factor [Clostridiales bacterium]
MKKVKMVLSLAICLIVSASLVSCGSMSYDGYDLKEYIKVGKYKGLEVAPYAISITDDQVTAKIDSTLEAAATSQEVDKDTAIADGDVVNIDYVGKVNGKKFDGGSAKGYDLTIGSDAFINGFEDGLIGKKTGEKVALNLTFPDDYSTEKLQGKDVVFKVTINLVTREVVPEYNLEFVKNTTEYTTLGEYEDSIRETLYKEKETEAINNQKTELWSVALDNTEVKKYPEKELNHYIDFNSEQMDVMAESYGMTREDLLASYDFGSEKEFAAVNEDSSKLRVKQEMVITYIANKEGIEYTDKEKEALIADFKSQGYDESNIEAQVGRPLDEYVHIELLYQKVLDMLLKEANITGLPTVE